MNEKKGKLKINIVLNTIFELLILITPFITAPYISRVLLASGVGSYSYTYSLVTYFTLFAGLGTATYGKREIGRRRDNVNDYSAAFWEIELLTIITSLICIGIWLPLCYIYQSYTSILLILSLNIVAVMFDISWLYIGLEKYVYTVTINSLAKILNVVFIFLLVKSEKDLNVYVLISSLSLLLGNLSLWLFLPKIIKKSTINLASMKTHLKETLVYFVPTIASTLYSVIDKTLIGIITDNPSENGYYEQAMKIISISKVLAYTSINAVMNSRLNYLYKINDKAAIETLKVMDMNIVLFLSIGASFGIAGVSDLFVPLFFGEGYEKTINLLYILSPILSIMCISGSLGAIYYTPIGKRKQSAIYLIIGSGLNLLLNCLLIPFLGSYGAAIASIIGEILISLLYVIKCGGFYSFKLLWNDSWKKIIAGAIMFGFCFLMGKSMRELLSPIIILIIQVGFGFLLYFLLLLIFKDQSIGLIVSFIRGKKYEGRKNG